MISLKKIEQKILQNKLLFGILIITLNILSKNIKLDLSPAQKYLLNNIYVRQILIFSMIFIGTKDLKISFILTGSFYVLSSHILHEDSPFSILPHSLKTAIDENNDNKISDDEIENAINTLNKARSINTSTDSHKQDMLQMSS